MYYLNWTEQCLSAPHRQVGDRVELRDDFDAGIVTVQIDHRDGKRRVRFDAGVHLHLIATLGRHVLRQTPHGQS